MEPLFYENLHGELLIVIVPVLLCGGLFTASPGIRRALFEAVLNIHRNEKGAAYSLSFVMVLPFYVFFLCLVMEIMFLMIAKMGTIHASLAAARAASVHTTVASSQERLPGFITLRAQNQAKQAAVVAMMPFASGFDPNNKSPSPLGNKYLSGYRDFVKASGGVPNGVSDIKDDYILARFASAEKRMTVKLEPGSRGTEPPCKQNLVATVKYDAPFRLPYIGRLLGGKSSGGAVVKTITSVTTLEMECPQNVKGFLGVPVPVDSLL